MRRSLVIAAAVALAACGAAMAQTRPPLFLSEPWVSTRGAATEIPLTQANVTSKDLELHTIGADMQISGQNGPDAPNPPHSYNGLCKTACGIAFSKKDVYADLSRGAVMRLNSKVSGFHQARPLVKLADGTWLVGDHAVGAIGGAAYVTSEFALSDLRWIKFDPDKLVTVGPFLPKVDLGKVEQVGYIDLIPGSGHGVGGWDDVGLFELYADSVPR